MNNSTDRLSVREIEPRDFSSIADYWLLSDKSYLEGMGVDVSFLPPKEDFINMLRAQIELPLEKKGTYALIWEVNGIACGHNNVNGITFGQSAYMHLHFWNLENAGRGMGRQFLKMSIPIFFRKLRLQQLVCEPYALNPAPNRILPKLDFKLEKTYTTTPGSICFEQEVNRWVLDRNSGLHLANDH